MSICGGGVDCLLDEQEPVCFFDHLVSVALQSLDGFAVGYKTDENPSGGSLQWHFLKFQIKVAFT